ncbi:DNA-processing protein DprA [Yinghuangia seranimata]|uniref:DNA-processing protein DprA n=1 Tax=Yinghuangia seranimata TaxID=408067 RepID=UPI00248B9D77|nr:DNA-processing protein DprA [Yinghuangia seranimata]MDI2129262.1 DNA-processing protein DprA [Yinghuangia seranimata]
MDDEHVARAALVRLGEPGDTALGAAVRVHGPQEVLRVLQSDGPLPTEFRRRDPAGYRVRLGGPAAADDLATVARLGGRFVVPGDRHWPTQLDDLGDARPIGLWERGPRPARLAALESVAVVGSRASTDYGDYVTGELAVGLAEARWTVVSGGAYGIDGAAHRGALAGGGPTVAVLACGIDVAYPRGHDRLLARIAEVGTVVSELPPGCPPSRVRFVERNRVIAALTRGTVVVEAAVRSGALVTARRAQRLGRVVIGVPGPVTAPQSAGVHQLLRDEETVLVTGAAEVVECVGRIGVDLAPPPVGPARLWDRLDAEAMRVLEAVPPGRSASEPHIARAAGVGPGPVAAHLAALRELGLVEPESDAGAARSWRRASAPPLPPEDGEAVRASGALGRAGPAQVRARAAPT